MLASASGVRDPHCVVDDEKPLVGRYALGEVLGSGGMGVVHAAFDPLLDRRIALKLIKGSARADEADPSERPTTATGSRTRVDRERLRDEARALAQLAHPNIVEVFDVGVHGNGVFLAMELVEGQSLRSWIEAAPRTWSEVLAVYVPTALALAAAHGVGIVHGDMKPDNVLRGHDGRIKVVDFGLAQAASTDMHDDRERVLEIFGTPPYLAPECWHDRQRTAASDQFAFFVSMFEALWARRPFIAEGRDFTALHAKIVAGLEDVPATPAVPRALASAVLRGLSRRPRDRFVDMHAAIATLRSVAMADRRRAVGRRALLAGAAVLGTSGAVVAGSDAWRTVQRERAVTACRAQAQTAGAVWNDDAKARVAGAMATAAPNLGSATFERIAPLLDDHVAQLTVAYEASCDVADDDRALATLREVCLDERREALGATIDVLADPEPEVVVAAVQSVATLPAISRCTDDAWLAAQPTLPVDPAVRGRVAVLQRQLMVAERLGATARNQAGLELAQRVLDDARALGDAPMLARAELAVALRMAAGEATASEWLAVLDALQAAYFATLEAHDHASAARAAVASAQLLGKRLGRIDDALQWCRHADARLAAIAVPDGELTALRHVACSGVLAQAGRTSDALAAAQLGLELRIDRFGVDHPLVAAAHSAIGAALATEHRNDDALARFAIAKEISVRTLGPQHPEVATILSNMATIELSRGAYSAGRALGEQALAIREASFGRDHVDVATSLVTIGWAAYSENDLTLAATNFRRAIEIRETKLGRDHPAVATVLGNLSIVVRAQGHCTEAVELVARALAIAEARAAQPAAAISALLGLADARVACGEPQRALVAYRDALQRAEQAGAPAAPERRRALRGEGKAELALGHPARAIAPLQTALGEQLRVGEDPLAVAETEYLLAKAIHDTHGDPRHATGLGLLAHFTALATGPRATADAGEIAAWLRDTTTSRRTP